MTAELLPEPGTRLILASASAVRAQLLAGAGVPVDIVPSAVDEDSIKAQAKALSVEDLALRLAAAKAAEVSRANPDAAVIGADQILDFGGALFDKPKDRAAAAANLKRFRGKSHRLVTACTVYRDGTQRWDHVTTATLTMRDFGDTFLERYLDMAGDEVCASVGAYRLEDLGAQLFTRIDGDYFAILGLPLLPLLEFLRGEGLLLA